LRCGIEGDAWIALYIDHARDLDTRRTLDRIAIAVQPVLHVVLVGHGEYHDVAFALQFLSQALPSGQPELIVIGADEEEPLAGGRVRIHGDYGNSGRDGLVDAVFQQYRIGYTKQNSSRFLLHCLIEGIALGLGVVTVGSQEIRAHLELFTSFGETGASSLPVRNLQIGRYEYEVLVGIMSATAEQGSDQDCQPEKRTQLA
jgi:hypothetical protein